MANTHFAARKISGKTALMVLLLLSIPAFFWFRFLYSLFFVETMTPEMQKMRDAMMQPHPSPTAAPKPAVVKKPPVRAKEKGEKITHP